MDEHFGCVVLDAFLNIRVLDYPSSVGFGVAKEDLEGWHIRFIGTAICLEERIHNGHMSSEREHFFMFFVRFKGFFNFRLY